MLVRARVRQGIERWCIVLEILRRFDGKMRMRPRHMEAIERREERQLSYAAIALNSAKWLDGTKIWSFFSSLC